MSHWSLQPRSENMAKLTRCYLAAPASPSTTVSPCSSILYSFQEFPLPLSWSMLVGMCAQSCPTLCDPWTVAHQDPLSMWFSRQEYLSGLPFPSAGDLSDPGIESVSLGSPALSGGFCLFVFFYQLSHQRSPSMSICIKKEVSKL